MSSVTAFNFRAFECDLDRDKQLSKKAVSLSAMTPDDLQRLPVVEIRTPLGREHKATPWAPVSHRGGGEEATFWDPRMGNFDMKSLPTQSCTTCKDSNQRAMRVNERCGGHYGYVSMPRIGREGQMVVFNPLLFKDLMTLLRSQCFVCMAFRIPEYDALRWELAFTLFDAGLVGEALGFLSTFKPLRGATTFSAATSTAAASPGAAVATKSKGKRQREAEEAEDNAAEGAVIIEDLDHDDGTGMKQYTGLTGLKKYVRHRFRACKARGDLPANDAERLRILHCVVDVRNNLVQTALREFADYPKACSRCHAESPAFSEKDGQVFIKYSARTMERLVALNKVEESVRQEWLAEMRIMKRQRIALQAAVAMTHMKALCERHSALLASLLHNLGEATVPIPFNEALPAEKLFRPFFLDRILVPPVSARIAAGARIKDGSLQADERTTTLNDALKFVLEIENYYAMKEAGHEVTDRQYNANESNIRNLQLNVNKAYDEVLGSFAKKEGLFRMHMMGKRVNQACRSVISPDFTVEPNEILLPRPFARNLSYPERVVFYDPGRAALLKQCVKNGPAVYPGATHIELRKPSGAVESVDLSAQGEEGRGRIADAHFEMAKNGREVYVYRHVLDGDRVVFNRQPTLHRPSMQSYEAKVLSSLRTIRFHYVNGKSYNADFDGDEMNVHVPQSLECRSELDVIMDANMNFLAPTSGRPIRGLIQDHCIAGVLLTVRDRFFDREQFTQLVYSGLQPYLKSSHDLTTFIPIPAILKPVPMWTGKQVITAALRFLTGVNPANPGEGANVGVSCKGASQSYQSKWSTHDGSRVADHDLPDDPVLIRDSELLVGVLDKAQLGPTHLAVPHALFDVYGPHVAGKFFGAIGRILTYALRYDGLSLGVEDMLLTDKQGLHDALREIDLCALDMDDEGATIGLLNKKASVVHGDQLPTKLRVPFPKNDLVTMTTTGAKGSSTNAIQMAVMLGQQTFDGQRIKPMSSHKTMPSFFPGERRARSFGFAMGRFVSGIRPAEYTIHAMAGREGLIDTAVKTARSGYLQRCLVKGLESLTVHWDGTVRDSNGSVVQFKFGGDGLDPCRASTAKQWDVIHRNMADLQRRYETGAFAPRPTVPEDPEEEDSMDEDAAAGPGQKWQTSMRDREMSSELPAHIADSLKRANLEPTLKPRTVQRWDRKGQKFDRIQQAKQELKSVVSDITKARLTRSMCEPGEAVGIVAAQAAGEPSTQMTLNTFHQAGATVTHVTEGIPRLRELLMYASVAKAAVIVPVKSLNNGELDVIRRIHDRVKPTPVAQLCAQVRRQFQWGVTRADGKATVRLAVLLSKPALDQHRRALGIGKADHVVLISSALKQLGKNICAQLRGRTDPNAAGGGGGGVTRQAVLDPTALLPEEEEHDAVARTMSAMDNDADDLADVSRRVNSDSDDDDEDEDDDKSVASEKAAADSDDDDDAEVPVAKDDESSAAEDDIPFAERFSTKKAAPKRSAKSSGADASVMTYDQFPAVDCTCVKNTMHLQVWPAKVGSVMDVTKASAELVDNIVVAQVKIVMPSDVIAVVPDVVKSCLASTMVRGKGPQVEKVQWIPDANGQKGELVFQGEGASLKTAMSLLAPYVDVHTGIDLRNITSTDVRDLAETFGIEAAYQALLKELSKLFARHSVDERHLSLMSDVATHRGIWQAFNYNGMISQSSSPLFQMTFASSRKFLEKAISRGVPDDLNSFSAAIMVGERPKVGTATVGVAAEPEVVKDVISERAASKLKPMPAPPAFTL